MSAPMRLDDTLKCPKCGMDDIFEVWTIERSSGVNENMRKPGRNNGAWQQCTHCEPEIKRLVRAQQG